MISLQRRGSQLQRFAKRSAAKHAIVSIGPKGGNTTTDKIKMHVWVVWSDVQPTNGIATFNPSAAPTAATYATDPNNRWRFKFVIQPSDIISTSANADIPALNGALPSNAPEVPGAQKLAPTRPIGNTTIMGDNATMKWDVSRQMKWKVTPPQGMAASALSPPFPTDFTASQPNYAANPVEGNDDPGPQVSLDEDDDPYQAKSGDFLDHAVGELSSKDRPAIPALNSWGGTNRTISVEIDFREFARVQLWESKRTTGTFWFRISEHKAWHHNLEATWDGSAWKDGIGATASSADLGNTN